MFGNTGKILIIDVGQKQFQVVEKDETYIKKIVGGALMCAALYEELIGGKDDIDPHDRVEVKGSVNNLTGDLLHYSYRSVSHHVDMLNRYTETMALLKHQRGKGFTFIRMLFRVVTLSTLLWRNP